MLSRLALLGLILPALVLAADVESGPEKGAKVPKLEVYDCTGENKDKSVDYAGLRKDKVTVYLFVPTDKFDRPMFRFMKTLDEKTRDMKDVYLVAVWLTDDEDKTREYLPKISSYFETTALTSFKGKDGPKGWTINNDARLTVVVAGKGKVAARFGYNSINDADVPPVVKEIEKLTKK